MSSTPRRRAADEAPSWPVGALMAIEPAAELAWELTGVDDRVLHLAGPTEHEPEVGAAVLGWPSGDRWSSAEIDVIEVGEGRPGVTRIVAEVTGEVRSTQRRRAFRTAVALDAEVVEVEAPAPRPRPATVVNLSAGGAAMLCHRPPPAGSSIALWMALGGDGDRITTVARVVTASPSDGDDRPLVRTSFEQIFPDDQELVARFVQQQELERRRMR